MMFQMLYLRLLVYKPFSYLDVVILPMYERGFSFVVDPRLKDFRRRSVGPEVDYNYAYIEQRSD